MSKTAESATHSLAITADGGVEATPLTASGNRFGQCGDGSAERRCEMRTRRVGGLTGVVAVAAGGGIDAGHSLAVTRHGDTYAWGCDRWQQLGLGSAEAGAVGYTWEGGKLWQTAPRRVEALRGIVDVAAGADHSLALARDGQVYAWGRGNDGQLGDRAFVGPPRRLAALSASKSRTPIAVGAQNACSCAIFDDGSIGCVGACARVGAALREALREKASLLL